MNAVLMLLLLVSMQTADWTPAIAAEGAVVTLETAKEPAPRLKPDSGASATVNDILRGIRLPAPPVGNPQTYPQLGGPCPGGVCPVVPSPVGSHPSTSYYRPAPQPRLLGRFRR